MKIPTVLTLLISFFLCSCGGKKATQADKEAIDSVLARNIKAHHMLDPKELKATSTGSTGASLEAQLVTQHFGESDFFPKFESSEIVDFSEKEAKVKLVIYKTATESQGTDEKETAVYKLKKIDGEWRVSNRETIDSTPVVE